MDSEKSIRKSCDLRTTQGTDLDIVLHYLEGQDRTFSSIVEELLIAVYLVPALHQSDASPKDINLACVDGVGFLDKTAQKLRTILGDSVKLRQGDCSTEHEIATSAASIDSPDPSESSGSNSDAENRKRSALERMSQIKQMIQM